MKILVAANYLKGSLSAIQAAQTIERSILEVDNSILVEKIPIADGGDGTLDAITSFSAPKEMTSEVTGPLGNKIKARWLIFDENTAVIEAAQANGLCLLSPDEYNPMLTTSYGVGELIRIAMEKGCGKIFVTIGGSSTNDGGIGLLQALGAKFQDNNGQELPSGGESLQRLSSIDLSGLHKRLGETEITCACDVENPLCGENGASFVYAPQKGASPEGVKILDKGLETLANATEKLTGRDYRNFPGVGAAGGISFALKAFLNARLIPGFELIAELSGIEEKIRSANLVITTEGRFDSQTLRGKAPYQTVKLAKKYNIPVIMLAGSIERGLDIQKSGITAAFSIVGGPVSMEDSVNNAEALLANTAKQVINLINTFIQADF